MYWLIERASSPKQANLIIEQADAKMTLALTLPGSKKAINDEWGQAEMPVVPVLTNKQAIKAHTKLQVFRKAN